MKEELEIWRNMPEYEGLYQVSSLGRIKALSKITIGRKGIIIPRKEKLLNPQSHRLGYLKTVIVKNGIRQIFYIHRMVAIAFIPNPNNYPCVNHLNSIRDDNRVENLEWCTHAQNMRYSWENNNRKAVIQKKGKDSPMARAVNQYDLEMNFIKSWGSIKEAARALNINGGNISNCCSGYQKTAYGFKWRYNDSI